MKIYNLFFNKEDKQKFPDAGWHLANNRRGLKLTANVTGSIKTVVSSSEELMAEYDDGNAIGLDDICLKPLYKSAKLAVSNTVDDLNFALYVKVEEGQQISSIKLEGCSVVMSSIDNGNRQEAAMLIVVQDKNNYKVTVYQTDKKVIFVKNGNYQLSKVDHVLNMSKKIKPRLYLQMPVNTFITSNLNGVSANVMRGKGFEIMYAPLLLLSNKYLDMRCIMSDVLMRDDYLFVIDGDDDIKWGDAIRESIRASYKYLRTQTYIEYCDEYIIPKMTGSHRAKTSHHGIYSAVGTGKSGLTDMIVASLSSGLIPEVDEYDNGHINEHESRFKSYVPEYPVECPTMSTDRMADVAQVIARDICSNDIYQDGEATSACADMTYNKCDITPAAFGNKGNTIPGGSEIEYPYNELIIFESEKGFDLSPAQEKLAGRILNTNDEVHLNCKRSK